MKCVLTRNNYFVHRLKDVKHALRTGSSHHSDALITMEVGSSTCLFIFDSYDVM